MKRDVRQVGWFRQNQETDARAKRWWTPLPERNHWYVRTAQHTKYGHVRWETQLGYDSELGGAGKFLPRLFWYYPTKAEATAKGVELVLKGYATRVIDD